MVQQFNLQPVLNQGGQLGRALGMGISKNFEPPEQRVQRGVLRQALQNLQNAPQGTTFPEQLALIGPELLTASGGSELLGILAPLLQNQARNEAFFNRQQPGQAPSTQAPAGQVTQQVAQGKEAIQPQTTTLTAQQVQPGVAQGVTTEESLFPGRGAQGYTQPLLTPDQLMARAQQIAQTTGADPQEAMKLANIENQNILAHNEQIRKEQEAVTQANESYLTNLYDRAKESNLITDTSDPEERTVFETLALKNRHLGDLTKSYDKTKRDFQEFRSASTGIDRIGEVPGLIEKIARQFTGSYKNIEETQKLLKPSIDVYKKFGLIPELRNKLSTNLGMGPEDTETAIFPFSKEEKTDLNKFKKNPGAVPITGKNAIANYNQQVTTSKLSEKDYNNLKSEMSEFISKYPNTNLVALRGYLTRDKGYPWLDVATSYNDLINEGILKPNTDQREELNITNNAPIPGLNQLFVQIHKGTK